MSGSNGHQQAPLPLEVLQERFEQIRDANQADLADLERRGMALDPMSFLHARLDKLIDSIAQFAGPNGPRWALLTRLQFEEHIAEQIQAVDQQATKAQLAQGALFTPGMIAELARQSGMFRPRT